MWVRERVGLLTGIFIKGPDYVRQATKITLLYEYGCVYYLKLLLTKCSGYPYIKITVAVEAGAWERGHNDDVTLETTAEHSCTWGTIRHHGKQGPTG